jgi:FkbM family methyltransferase
MTIRKRLKNLLASAGYSVRKLTRFEWLLQRELDTGRPFVFVQVGANDGISFDNLYQFVTKNNASGLVIEPLSDMFERLRYNYRGRPNIKPIRAAVHPTASVVTIHRVSPEHVYDAPHWATGIGSIDATWHENIRLPTALMVEEKVPAVHLMQLLRDNSITRLSLLQVDVEGFDAEVIRMLDFGVIRPSIIKYECVHLGESDSTPALLHRSNYRLEREDDNMIAWLE